MAQGVLRRLVTEEATRYGERVDDMDTAFMTGSGDVLDIDVPVVSWAPGANGAVYDDAHLRHDRELDLSAFPGTEGVDPFAAVAGDMRGLTDGIKEILGVDHPVLSTVAKYFFDMDGGKKMRPAMVMLVARACNAHVNAVAADAAAEAEGAAGGDGAAAGAAVSGPEAEAAKMRAAAATPRQKRLAEITEMIHTASLLHDDVIDMADTRRGVGSVNRVFGNQMAVLAGDFLLARASVCLARLRNVDVIELLSTVIEHLVKGEVMQMKTAFRDGNSLDGAFNLYMRKTYYKTASLMANSCKAAAILAGHPPAVQESAFLYGKHVGLAFQLVDDVLDFEGSLESLGKPALNDLASGLATAPVLFATRDHPDMIARIQRKFEAPGDVEAACACVKQSDGVALTKALALGHAQMALDSVAQFRPSVERTALAALVLRVVHRKF